MTATGVNHKVVSKEQWIQARKELLQAEKALTAQHDALSRKRRELPWERVEKNYVFDGPNGPETLASLFGEHSQLIVYHFMFGPDWEEGCPSCSFLADHFDGTLVHLAHRDTALRVISRAPIEKIEAFKKRMGWRFHWVSSYRNDFNHDYHVSFHADELASGKAYYNYETSKYPLEELPGLSVFYKDPSGEIFHTYSAFARGTEAFVGTYQLLDIVPKGRDEDGLAFTMAWVRHHDRYENYQLDSTATYRVPKNSCCSAGEHA
jgi:predicted dithiol-disulfide oxidoreductase (DUF899 family)